MTRSVLVWAALLSVACGGAQAAEPSSGATSAGGEEPIEDHPMRTTIPVPVPQPAVARDDLSEPLRRFWTSIEETVAIRPPEGPAEASSEAVQAWADGPFAEWIARRREAMGEAVGIGEQIADEPPYERGVAAALLGYALEDFVFDVRGSPVPADIAADAELLAIYVSSLQEALRPLAQEAVGSYAYCQQRFLPLGDDSEWLPWRAYCVQRGREMIEVFQLVPAQQEGGEDAPEAEGEPSS